MPFGSAPDLGCYAECLKCEMCPPFPPLPPLDDDPDIWDFGDDWDDGREDDDWLGGETPEVPEDDFDIPPVYQPSLTEGDEGGSLGWGWEF